MTTTRNDFNRVKAFGTIIECRLKSFFTRNKEYTYYVLAINCEFHDLYNDKFIKVIHATNVWSDKLKAICAELKPGDQVEVESTLESDKNKKDPSLYFHKVNALKIVKK
jgi:hypothetical protein